jgi:hypothetical protein
MASTARSTVPKADIKQLKPVHPGHANVRKNEVEGLLSQQFQGFLSTLGAADLVTLLLQEHRHHGADALLVIDNQYFVKFHEYRLSGSLNRLTRGHPSTSSGQSGEGETRRKVFLSASPRHRVTASRTY